MSFHDPIDFLSRPIIGVSTSLGSVIVSLLPHLETAMRLAAHKAWRDRHK
jgi:hypothetical protein